MTHYRCFLLNDAQGIADFLWLDCPDEAAALRRARDLMIERQPAGIEIWEGPRRVARLLQPAS